MPMPKPRLSRFAPSLSLVLLAMMMMVLWVAGGGSRADVQGQAVVRGFCVFALIALALFGDWKRMPDPPVLWILLAAMIALPLVQLIPLPPSLWQALPGRGVFAQAAENGAPQPWRPWSIVPDATLNAAMSLVVPVVALLLVSGLRDDERRFLPAMLLGTIIASMLLGLLQFSGAGLDNPLINEVAGGMSGSFANRNHFALFLALGCLIAPVWVFLGGRGLYWRGPTGIGLILLFVLAVLGSGSRAGMVLSVLALIMGTMLVAKDLRRAFRGTPRWALPAIVVGMASCLAMFVLISIAADRAVSVQRLFAVSVEQDMRGQGLPVVLAMIRSYFPFGSGIGGFDPVFRLHEPFGLLAPSYFNHAHDDFLEILLDGGILGAALLAAAIGWWLFASIRAWRGGTRMRLARTGSAMLLLILIASVFDYPARTPMMMMVVVIAAVWLHGGGETGSGRAALPRENQHL